MLLNYKFKPPGAILIFIGLILTILYFSADFRFEIPVIALFSSYFETKFFTTFRTNFADELILLVFLTGFFLVVFSKEKKETDFLKTLRIKAMVKAAVADIAIMIFSVLFIFGSGFMGIVIFNIFLPFILYLCIFNFMKFRGK